MQVQIVYFLAPTHFNSLSCHQHKIIKHSYTNKRWSLFVSLLRKTSARLLLITHTAEFLLNIKRNQVLKWSNVIYDAAAVACEGRCVKKSNVSGKISVSPGSKSLTQCWQKKKKYLQLFKKLLTFLLCDIPATFDHIHLPLHVPQRT